MSINKTKEKICTFFVSDYHFEMKSLPYITKNLEKEKKRIILEGDVPSPIDLPAGCPFAGRCRYATEECRTTKPELVEAKPGHFVACHHPVKR